MAEKSFAKRVMNTEEDARKGFKADPQHTGRAFALRIELKNGRRIGLAWALFNDYEMETVNGKDGEIERLTLLFSCRVVTVEGHRLGRLIDEIDEEHLLAIREHDRAEVMSLKSGDEPVITRVSVEPTLDVRKDAILTKGEVYEA